MSPGTTAAAERHHEIAATTGSTRTQAAGVMTAEAVRVRTAECLGDASGVDAGHLWEVTGGIPRLVELVLTQLLDDDLEFGREAGVPDPVLARVTEELESLDGEVREFLLAQSVGFSECPSAWAFAPRFARTDTRALASSARRHGFTGSDGEPPPVIREALLRSALGDEAWALLKRHQQTYGFTLEAKDVDAAPEWAQDYGDWVPVVLIDDKVRFRGKVNEVLLRRELDAS